VTFHSILFESIDRRREGETVEAPAFFRDLNLDQIVETITTGKEEYNLKPFFHTSLSHVDAVEYRHETLQDFQNELLLEHIRSFAHNMRAMRQQLARADKVRYKYEKARWFLDAVETYCAAVKGLVHNLSLADLKSRGLVAFRRYLSAYADSDVFTSVAKYTTKLKADLSTVKYCVLIKGNCVKVRKHESEPDYSADIEATFAKFKQGAVKDYRVKAHVWPDLNDVEARILDRVAQLYPDIFLDLDNFCTNNRNYLNETIAAFDREVQFYIAYLEYTAVFKRAGLKFCYPEVSDTCKEVYDYGGFDLALAQKLIRENSTVVCNDFHLKDKEHIFVVSGPNQGGKSTFARTFGQIHYLASIGCPVPGKEAQLFLFDKLFTHFEREEDIKNLRGKLQDDLVRIHDILEQATSKSIIIMNEIFTSTTLRDAVFLSKRVMEQLIELGLLSVWVTFIDELASFGEETVSMVSTIVPENPALRTYKIIRKPADGLSYAMSIAEKHGVTYKRLKERIKA
jgi:DNA mismatch repair protein MutS